MSDLISRQDAIAKLKEHRKIFCKNRLDFTILPDKDKARVDEIDACIATLINLPSAQPERLTDDDFETIRIHLNAYKGKLCNQHRWEEAEEYQRLIDRFMRFASAQPEQESFEWCHDCKEYDQEQHCCHRWTKTIRKTVDELKQSAQPEPMEVNRMDNIGSMKYYVCCPWCDLPKCVKGAPECEAEQWAQARRKEGEQDEE